MDERFSRTAYLLGEDGVERLWQAKVAVFGLGGVGGMACEALARCGVGKLVLVDNDVVSRSNLNRQVIATVDTIGRKKTEVMKERIAQIAPGCQVECHDVFYLPGVTGILDESVDYAVDAIDTVTAKLFLAEECQRLSIPLISSMGTGNKLDPSRLTVTDIYQTSVCPLAKVMRRELRKRGIEALKVVYSTEEPKAVAVGEGGRRAVPGSVAFVPPAAGLLLASEVVKDLLEGKNHG